MKNLSLSKGISILAIILILSSCGQLNIQKRQYSGGWTLFSGKGVKSEKPVARQHRKPAKTATPPLEIQLEATAAPAEVFSGDEIFPIDPAPQNTATEKYTSPAKAPVAKMNFIQKLALKKAIKNIPSAQTRSAQKKQIPAAKNHKTDDTEILLLILLVLIFAPLAVLYYEDWEITLNFWLCLLFWLILILPGIIYALWVIFGDGGLA